MATELAGRRMGVLALVAVSLFAMLGGRLYFLQVMQPEEFEQIVAGNRVREIVTEAPRGRIIDAKGRVIAGLRESLVVTLDWTVLREVGPDVRAEVFADLADELSGGGIKTKADRLASRYASAVDGTLKPVVVAEDIGPELWIRLREAGLPGIGVESRNVRTYPYGSVAAHLLGYTSTVRNAEIAAELNLTGNKTYFPGDELGVAGLEKEYESVLRGTPEIRRVEVDAQNRVVRTVEVVQEEVPGEDLRLTIDIDLQYAAEQILIEELDEARGRRAGEGNLPLVADSGSLVAIDVNDGSVVALASYPTFDPRDFTFGISSSLWNELSNRSDVPLLDRSIRGAYPAGSTFKPFVAYAALEAGVRDQYTTWVDEGVYTLVSCIDPDDRGAGCTKRNAGSVVMGPVQLREAMERSSDTYFYSIGEQFWINQAQFGRTGLQDVVERFGFGSETGIDLPSQYAGLVPTPERLEEIWGDDFVWYPGDNVNLAIGQGYFVATPLQLANAYAMLGTGGRQYEPRLVDAFVSVSGEVRELEPVLRADENLDPAILAPIYDGLLQVVNPRLGTGRGTGQQAFAGFPLDSYPIAGKTGTAQVIRKADFSLFAAFGPHPEPEYAVAAVLEQAGFGGDAAGPAVRRFFDLLAGNVPIPEAPLAEERALEVVGLVDVDLQAAIDAAAPVPPPPVTEPVDVEPAPEANPRPTQPPATAPPTTAAPTTAPPTTTAPTTAPPTTAGTSEATTQTTSGSSSTTAPSSTTAASSTTEAAGGSP